MTAQEAAYGDTADAARKVCGIIAARSRGDFDGAEVLVSTMDDAERAAGGVFLSDIAIALLANNENRSIEDVAGELSLLFAEVCAQQGG